MIEIRTDPISKKIVIINDIREHSSKLKREDFATQKCVFCKGNEQSTPMEIDRVSDKKGWSIRVFPNKFPILTLQKFKQLKKGLYESYKGHGKNEVIVLTPKHNKNSTNFDTKKWFSCLKMYKKRFEDNSKLDGIKYVQLYQNEGVMAGASLKHAHAQLLAIPFIPKIIKIEAKSCKEKLCCKMIKKELKSNRLIFKNKEFIAFTNFASRFPYESHIYPFKHIKSIKQLSEQDLYDLAEVIFVLLKSYSKILKPFDFNMVFHNAPKNSDFHFHIEIYPQINKWASVEYGTNIVVNNISPETASKRLRSHLK